MRRDPPADRAEPAASRRPRDMVISLLVLLVPVLLLVGGYQVVAGRGQPVAVDPAETLASAQRAGIEVTTPEGLDPGWVPVSAVFRERETGATVRVGYVTPSGESLQLLHSTVPAEELLADELPGSLTPEGATRLAGAAWQQYAGGGRQAVVQLVPAQTVLVFGSASRSELHTLVTALG